MDTQTASSVPRAHAVQSQAVCVGPRFAEFGMVTLLSAFLMFQLELIVAKHLLPWFGGSPAVWTTCMLFFQAILLAGYSFVHWGSTRLRLPGQTKAQLAVIFACLLSFAGCVLLWGSPLTPSKYVRDALGEYMVVHILLVLILSIGPTFFLLSTTSPLLQFWFRSGTNTAAPYRLYALSNIGSLFGLISYPFVLEWLLTLHQQAWLWNLLFALFVALLIVVCRGMKFQEAATPVAHAPFGEPPKVSLCIAWTSLAACGSMTLLATTNLLCEDVAVTPFLWVLPLCLYLLTFILCFDHPRWYKRIVFYPLYLAALWTALWVFRSGVSMDLMLRADAYLFVLFVICMICNGELSRSKPAPSQLTSFYLMVSLGGALGGVFVSIVAPRLFRGYWEFQITLIACGLITLYSLFVAGSPLLFTGIVWKVPLTAVLLLAAAFGLVRAAREQVSGRLLLRNFFGVKQVYDEAGLRYLRNGGVVHGMQCLGPSCRTVPLLYYSRETALGALLSSYPGARDHGRRIGAIGLGTGVVAAYGEPRDNFRFWEIDPQVIALSRGPQAKFTFLEDSKSHVEVVEGDGRLALEREQQPVYDILLVDAFSGDAIPIHLVTREAFRLYMSRLRGPDSVLVFHITNRIVDLTPVMLAFSRSEHVPVRFFMSRAAEYAMFSRNAAMLDMVGQGEKAYPWAQVDSVLWTDDHSSLLHVLRR